MDNSKQQVQFADCTKDLEGKNQRKQAPGFATCGKTIYWITMEINILKANFWND